jgi:peroxiredoxin
VNPSSSSFLVKYLPLVLAALVCQSLMAGAERVENFALLDHQGRFHELRQYGDARAVVFIGASSTCAQMLDELPRYQLLRTTWERQGVAFVAIASSPQESLQSVRTMDEAYHLELPILLDESQLIAENLGLSRAGEIVVIEPQRLHVMYRGGLDSRANPTESGQEQESDPASSSALADTLQAAVAGQWDGNKETVVVSVDRPVSAASNESVAGCELTSPAREGQPAMVPDYSAEVAPIIAEKCATCHVDGGIAPFAMDSHTMVQGWSPMMREVLLTRRMPPTQVDPNVKHFANARYIDPEELRTLVHWINAGAPRGSGENDPLAAISKPHSRWELGEPDYIVRVPAFTIPATGVLDYENVTINLPFTEDRWVKSVQHLPGDRRVLHHLLSFIVPADYDKKIVEGENDEYRELLEGYAPGKDESSTYPDNTGVFVPAGSAVQMSLHYTTFGKEVVDETLLGLYFAEQAPDHHYSTYSLSHGGDALHIPPGVSEHKMRASHVFNESIVLHGLRPHMHFRGKYMRFSVVYPDGDHEQILNVPNYNFAWQPTYRLSEPLSLPAGSRVIIEGAFDNSQYNLGNPDPGAEVRGGAQSWDEMFIGYFSYHRQ